MIKFPKLAYQEAASLEQRNARNPGDELFSFSNCESPLSDDNEEEKVPEKLPTPWSNQGIH